MEEQGLHHYLNEKVVQAEGEQVDKKEDHISEMVTETKETYFSYSATEGGDGHVRYGGVYLQGRCPREKPDDGSVIDSSLPFESDTD